MKIAFKKSLFYNLDCFANIGFTFLVELIKRTIPPSNNRNTSELVWVCYHGGDIGE